MSSNAIPMIERPSYIAGVERARQEREDRQGLIAKRHSDFVESSRLADKENAKVAKEHAAANKAKYGDDDRYATAMFTPVPKGSRPIVKNPFRHSVNMLRATYRIFKRRGWTDDRMAVVMAEAIRERQAREAKT